MAKDQRAADVSIDVSDVSKAYRVYDRPINRLKQAVAVRSTQLSRRLGVNVAPRQYFSEFWALKNVSFIVKKGECVGVLGRNGAGKSTLLEIIAGTVTPTCGEAWVNGRIAALLELGSGFSREFTGRENIVLSAALMGLSRQETEAKFDSIQRFAEIGDFIDRPVKTYSSGMLLRLAFAVYIALEPSVLIVDEALAVGDARFQKRCYDRINSFRRDGGTVLFVTHDMHLAVQLCDRALILEKGEIYDQGESDRVVREYHKLLFGSPSRSRQATQPNISSGEAKADSSPSFLRSATTGSKELRYGSGRALISSMELRDENQQATKAIVSGALAAFEITVIYQTDIDEPIAYGFIITNPRGIEVYGTKSSFFGDFLPAGRTGTIFLCKLKAALFLVPGVYFLTAALATSQPLDENAYLDCRFDALEFEVVGNPRCFTTSIVDLGGEISHKVAHEQPKVT